jgi:hypothetical protein
MIPLVPLPHPLPIGYILAATPDRKRRPMARSG